MRQLLRDARGVSLYEFALAAPIVVFLMIGVVDLGRYMWDGILVGNAARAAADYGAENEGSVADATNIAAHAILDDPNLTTSDITSKPYCACDTSQTTSVDCSTGKTTCSPNRMDEWTTVTVSHQFQPLINYPGLPSPITITRTVTRQVTN